MAAISFKQGEDKKIDLNVMRDGAAVDITVCTNVKAIIKVKDAEQSKYALVPEGGFGTLTVGPTPTNLLTLKVERTESKNFVTGPMTVIVLCAFPDVDFPDGERVEEYKFTPGRIDIGEGVAETI